VIDRTNTITEKEVMDDLDWPPRFKSLVPFLYKENFDCYDFGLVYYLINKGQTGIHKICSTHNDYREAKKALDAFDPVLRTHTEIRVGMLIEGHPIGESMTQDEYEEEDIKKAADFARQKHAGQKRKYNGNDYFTHPQRLAETANKMGYPAHWVAALYLHDVVEDCGVSLREIEGLFPDKEFGEKVTKLVDGLTNKFKNHMENGKPASRKVRKQKDHERLASESKEVKICKMLDRIDNLQEMEGAETDFKIVYAKESLALAEVVGDGDAVLKEMLVAMANKLLKKGESHE